MGRQVGQGAGAAGEEAPERHRRRGRRDHRGRQSGPRQEPPRRAARSVHDRGEDPPLLQPRPALAGPRACAARPLLLQALLHRPRAIRRGRHHRPVELPHRPDDPAHCLRPAGGQHRFGEAVGSGGGHRRAARGAVWPRAGAGALRPLSPRRRPRGRGAGALQARPALPDRLCEDGAHRGQNGGRGHDPVHV